MPADAPTRQRLLDAGMTLFAERGFTATTVGDIEAAAGLQPRRGALYKHYPSKAALLDAGARRHIEVAMRGAAQIGDLDFSAVVTLDPVFIRPLLRTFGTWFLAELDQHRALTHLLEHEGDRFPDLLIEIRRDLIDIGNRAAAVLLAAAVPDLEDPEGAAVVLLSSLVGLRRTAWTYGATPLGIDDERALDRWADVVLAFVHLDGD